MTTEGYVTLVVIRHPDGISVEGAQHQRDEALRSLEAAGLTVAGHTMGLGDANKAAWDSIRGFWGMEG